MTHLDLFSGIGGFALAADQVWPDIEHVFCEIDPFCQAVLKKHWPNSKIHGDIRTLTNTTNAGTQEMRQERQDEIFLLTGGFPCQPFSQAGKRKGTDDDRHLWPEMRRVIQEFFPRWVVDENVRGLLSIDGGLVFEQVCLDLEALGYEVQSFVIPACAVNAPHRRDRVWIIGHTKHDGFNGSKNRKSDTERSYRDAKRKDKNGKFKGSTLSRIAASDATSLDVRRRRQEAAGHHREFDREGTAQKRSTWDEDWPTAATRLCSLDDGLPGGLVRPRGWRNAALKAAGNAIVPQVAMEIFKAIKLTN